MILLLFFTRTTIEDRVKNKFARGTNFYFSFTVIFIFIFVLLPNVPCYPATSQSCFPLSGRSTGRTEFWSQRVAPTYKVQK